MRSSQHRGACQPIALLLSAVSLLALVGCARTPACPPVARDYPGVLRDPATITPDFLVRQTVEARHGAMSFRFDAALQKHGNTLTLIGFAPFGARAFVLKQTGSDVQFTQYLGRDLPFPPKYMLIDIDRAFFDEIPGGPHPDGEHSAQLNGEEIRETWAGGRLMQRRFRRLDGSPAGEIVIRYQGGMVPPLPPARVEFHNGWFGYDLAIDIHSYKRIERAQGTASSPTPQP
jgi:hypothetical protein